MKKLFFLIFFVLSFCSNSISQFSVIYDAGNNRDVLSLIAFTNNYNNNLSVYSSLSGDYVTASAPYWIRYYRNANSWINNVHPALLNGSTCYIGTGGFYWSTLECFIRSPFDTNFMFGKFHWISCPNSEDGYYTRLSRDNGQTISTISFGLISFDVDPQKDSIIYGIGSTYLIGYDFWKSTDKGNNWSSFNLPYSSPTIYDIVKVNPLKKNEVYLINDSLFYKSTNFGIGFPIQYTIHGGVSSLNFDLIDSSFYYTSSNVSASISGIYKSTTSGMIWQQVKSNLKTYSILISPDNHNIVYAATDSGIFRSTNAGLNWSRYFDMLSPSLKINGLVKFKNDGDTIYAANNKKIYKIWAQLIGIKSISTNGASEFSLSQNYPNPFNPSTKIKFNITTPLYPPEGGTKDVKLVIYDILSREVTTIVNQKLQPGSYEVEWNGTNYPSGVYFYKLIILDPETSSGLSFTETKRMVLLK